MITGDLIINQSEKMTEILSNELNESNRTPFLHLYIPRSFLFLQCLNITFDRVKRNLL